MCIRDSNTIWQIGHTAQQLHDVQYIHCGPGTPPMVDNPTIPTPWSPAQNDTATDTPHQRGDDTAHHAA
eukprot:10618091-Prorocentrum_lima.AAC.1